MYLTHGKPSGVGCICKTQLPRGSGGWYRSEHLSKCSISMRNMSMGTWVRLKLCLTLYAASFTVLQQISRKAHENKTTCSFTSLNRTYSGPASGNLWLGDFPSQRQHLYVQQLLTDTWLSLFSRSANPRCSLACSSASSLRDAPLVLLSQLSGTHYIFTLSRL